MNGLKTAFGAVLAAGMLTLPALSAEKAPSAEKLKPYKPSTCIVTDEKLGEMGKPYVHAYKGREIKFCCKGCLKDFNKDSAKYVQKLERLEKAKSK